LERFLPSANHHPQYREFFVARKISTVLLCLHRVDAIMLADSGVCARAKSARSRLVAKNVNRPIGEALRVRRARPNAAVRFTNISETRHDLLH